MVYFGYVKESVELFNWIRLLRAPSGLALDVSRDGASPTLLGNVVPEPHQPQREKFLSYIQSKSPFF